MRTNEWVRELERSKCLCRLLEAVMDSLDGQYRIPQTAIQMLDSLGTQPEDKQMVTLDYWKT